MFNRTEQALPAPCSSASGCFAALARMSGSYEVVRRDPVTKMDRTLVSGWVAAAALPPAHPPTRHCVRPA